MSLILNNRAFIIVMAVFCLAAGFAVYRHLSYDPCDDLPPVFLQGVNPGVVGSFGDTWKIMSDAMEQSGQSDKRRALCEKMLLIDSSLLRMLPQSPVAQ